jgi:2-oxoglutarate dehydrogenase E2 component (dihydrolipoamide succinyltransferase)
MPVEVRVPALGESVAEATVGAWRKREGEAVEAGEPLVELETDKVNMEVSAERSGLLERIERQAGETVQPGDVLALLGEGAAPKAATGDGRDRAPAASAASTSPAEASQAARAEVEQPVEPAQENGLPTGATGPAPPPQKERGPGTPEEVERPHSSSLARRIADEHGVDVSEVSGSGVGGRVTREDVERYLATKAATKAESKPSAVVAEREERIRMSRRRQTIAQRLVEAQQTAAMLTTFNEVDMAAVLELRRRQKEAFKERHGVGLGFMSFFTKAVVGALKGFPKLNAEIQGDEMVLKRYYDIGVAVATQEGLVVPVVRDAERKSFAEIEREVAQLAERARKNTLTLDDLRGGTFTITNGGVFGSLLSTPILSPPQVGILGMHRIDERPVARDGQVVIRPMMYLALTYDHRIVDGQEAVQFLVRIKELVESPDALLLES